MHVYRSDPRSESGPFISAWTVPISLGVLLVLAICRVSGRITTTSFFSLGGLGLDILGAVTLGLGLIMSRAARLRQAGSELTPRLLGRTAWHRLLARVPISAAKKLGPTDPNETAPTVVQELVDAAWGLVLLAAGFFLQMLGSIPGLGR